ncbi:MarR family transcriptional regulator [Kineococcus sp. R8]|uniref:MarR family transcriptional regulator n=1 Tax=Kineococcus siccus TaxID=2696567 RepID=UPI001412E3EB|nr:MarR family transcriptional regulator [Kineococcus siccus]
MSEGADWPTGRLLSTAARLVEHAWDDVLTGYGLTHSRLVILHLLSAGPATQRELARRSGMEEQTMGRMLRGMEEHGHVRRERDPADRRRSVVTATDDGRRALDEVVGSGSADDLLADVLAGSGHDAAEFRAALLHVVQHFARRRWPDGGQG